MLVFGVDPHKRTHTIAAVDEAGRSLGDLTIAATDAGHRKALAWALDLATRQANEKASRATSVGLGDLVWGVEDGRGVNRRLVAALLDTGAKVVAVPPKLMAGCRAGARTRGKSDPIDALAVARAVLREPDLPTAHLDEASLQVKDLIDHREDLVAQRTAWINRLRGKLVRLAPELEPVDLTAKVHQRRLLAALNELPAGSERNLCAEILGYIVDDTVRINALRTQITALVTPLAPALLEIPGVAALGAGKLIGEIAGIERFTHSAQLAALAGTAPIPVWTGNNERHRLNRGGNRQLNAVLHRIAITQVRYHPPAQALYERHRAAGKTKKGALRVLKRHLTRTVFNAMRADHHHRTHAAQPSPTTVLTPAA